jgi:hypothetical protein
MGKARPRTDSIVDPCFDCDTELCADAIRATHKQWVGVARCLEIEDATEAPDLGVCAGTSRCAYVGFDCFYERVSFIDGDPCLCIGEAWSG